MPFNVSELFSKQAKDDRKAFIKSLEALFLLPAGLSLMDEPPLPSNLLAGFCSISDWLGSSNNALNFSYVSEECDLMKYFNERYEKDASEIITTTGLISKPKIYQGVQALLKPEYSPRQLQTKVNLLPLVSGLSIVEGPTGSGKTELAIDYAWRLINEGLADSIIFALPSQATANGMLPRLDKLSGTLFHGHPNLLLAHGNARFNNHFSEIRNRPITVQGDEDSAAQCDHWLSQSRKRALLGQISVCTVDQVLMSVIPVKHRFIRGFCIGRSVLVVDEVHAYDAYMYGLMEEVLRNQKKAGGSAILLSATLPGFQKDRLLQAWNAEYIEKIEKEYPLITSYTYH
ncbi:CRISPR-associated endonuclease/helicase Cas3 [subsurface metagenome]